MACAGCAQRRAQIHQMMMALFRVAPPPPNRPPPDRPPPRMPPPDRAPPVKR